MRTRTSSLTVVLSLPLVLTRVSASAAWSFTPEQYTMCSLNCKRLKHHRAKFLVASGTHKIRRRASWPVWIVRRRSSKWRRRMDTAYIAVKHSLCPVGSFWSSSFKVWYQKAAGRKLPSFGFWNSTHSTLLSRPSVLSFSCRFIYGETVRVVLWAPHFMT